MSHFEYVKGPYQCSYMPLAFVNTGNINSICPKIALFIIYCVCYIQSMFSKHYRKHLKMCDNIS